MQSPCTRAAEAYSRAAKALRAKISGDAGKVMDDLKQLVTSAANRDARFKRTYPHAAIQWIERSKLSHRLR
jgi:hypothetical protein